LPFEAGEVDDDAEGVFGGLREHGLWEQLRALGCERPSIVTARALRCSPPFVIILL
jgi:hypothetical protein